MKTLKGPGIFLAQFIGAEPPFDKLETMAQWVASMTSFMIPCAHWP